MGLKEWQNDASKRDDFERFLSKQDAVRLCALQGRFDKKNKNQPFEAHFEQT